MSEKLDKLNRLRVNAGKAELKSWKASQDKLDEAITKLETEGFVDVVPGANADAAPVIKDPAVAKARPDPKPKAQDMPTNGADKEPTKVKPGLGRGLHDETYARNCRARIQDHRRAEREEKKENKIQLSAAEKQAIKDEAEYRKGRVNPKKDPAKAARQQKHIEDKKAARAAKNKANGKQPDNGRLKAVKDNEITVADIARNLGLDPKIARAKLRRHEDKISKLHTKGQDRWTFPKTAEKELAKILK